MSSDALKLQRLLGGAHLDVLRQRLMACAQRHAAPDKVFTMGRLLPQELRLLCELLGRPIPASGNLRLSIGALDTALAACGAAPSLRAALETLDGPWVDVRAERSALDATWQAVWDAISHPALIASLATVAARGRIKALCKSSPDEARRCLVQAESIIARLPAEGIPLAQLAAETTNNAHGLDKGSAVARLVLNALMPAAEDDDADESVRARWERLGVQAGVLNRPVLILNLPCTAQSVAGQLAEVARVQGEPLHLSLHALLRAQPAWAVRGRVVFVCENPSIVAAAAARLGAGAAPLVCTDGNPAAAQLTLLRQLRDAGALLRYHGDFDWDGLRTANFVLRELAASPWRMSAADYTPQDGTRLIGQSVMASWDASLTPAMQRAGLALHEEAVMETLLTDLADPASIAAPP